MEEKTIVRQNMMDDKNYSPYCGGDSLCTLPRTHWNGNGFTCKHCGWKSEFDSDFMERYKNKHKLGKVNIKS